MQGKKYLCRVETHSTADGPEGDHPLNAVRVAAAVGLKAGVVSLLQDKLLATEAGVLVAHPAARKKIYKAIFLVIVRVIDYFVPFLKINLYLQLKNANI